MVTVTEVDVSRKRIALTMKDGNERSDSRSKGNESRKPAMQKKESSAPMNTFQSKLMDLKKKFKD